MAIGDVTMGKILFIYERDMPTVSITRECFQYLNSIGKIESNFCQVQKISTADVNAADILFFIRPNDSMSLKIARQAKKSGRLIVVMHDDDLLNLPEENPFAPWRKKSMISLLEITDVLISSSQYLIDKYKEKFNIQRDGRIDTIVREEEFSNYEDDNHDEVKLVYAASPKHVGLFNQFILPILPELCERYGHKISLTCVGLYPEIDKFKEKLNISVISSMPLLKYRKYMQEQRFDIGLAPLITNDFTKCKYFNKYLEYSTARIVGVYSNTEPYSYVIRDGVNGFLADDDPKDWLSKLCLAIEDKNLRNSCVENAVLQIKQNHTAEMIADRLIWDIPEIAEGCPAKETVNDPKNGAIKYKIYRILDTVYLSIFYLKKGGIKEFLYKTKVHVNERNRV